MDPYKYIDSFTKFGVKGGYKPGLDRVNTLLKSVGNPEERLKIIHVAGTNGKGSTISFMKSIYMEAGYKVGVFTSPALISFNERMVVNKDQISKQELKLLVKKIIPHIEAMKNMNCGCPSYFELVTVLAFMYFKEQNVDLVLLEVGLGGRLDATNVVKKPLLSLITNISLEHTEILGDNLKDIAYEKAGIIKYERPVITAVQESEALNVIKGMADKRNSELIQIDNQYDYKIIDSGLYGQKIKLINFKENSEEEYLIGLTGEHQVRNSLLALIVVNKLVEDFPVKKDDIEAGLKNVKWPGRIEIIRKNPLLILDGAHNVKGIQALVNFLDKHISLDKKIYILLSVLKDKDIVNMIKALNFRKNLELIITVNKNHRVLAPEVIKELAEKEGIINSIYYDFKKAVNTLLGKVKDDDVICITGSLYTVAEAKKLMESSDLLV